MAWLLLTVRVRTAFARCLSASVDRSIGLFNCDEIWRSDIRKSVRTQFWFCAGTYIALVVAEHVNVIWTQFHSRFSSSSRFLSCTTMSCTVERVDMVLPGSEWRGSDDGSVVAVDWDRRREVRSTWHYHADPLRLSRSLSCTMDAFCTCHQPLNELFLL